MCELWQDLSLRKNFYDVNFSLVNSNFVAIFLNYVQDNVLYCTDQAKHWLAREFGKLLNRSSIPIKYIRACSYHDVKSSNWIIDYCFVVVDDLQIQCMSCYRVTLVEDKHGVDCCCSRILHYGVQAEPVIKNGCQRRYSGSYHCSSSWAKSVTLEVVIS